VYEIWTAVLREHAFSVIFFFSFFPPILKILIRTGKTAYSPFLLHLDIRILECADYVIVAFPFPFLLPSLVEAGKQHGK